MSNQEIVLAKNLDHHGLVAATIKDLGIIEKINRQIKKDKDSRRQVNTGEAIAVLILNGLGFTNRRLYMVSQFFKDKPVGKLLENEKIKVEHLNDDALGKALDEIADYGTTELFAEIASEIIKEQNLFGNFGRFDTTSISVEGTYDNKEQGEGIINITYGHSKDHSPNPNRPS